MSNEQYTDKNMVDGISLKVECKVMGATATSPGDTVLAYTPGVSSQTDALCAWLGNGADDHAFIVQVQCGKQSDQDIMPQCFLHAPGEGIIRKEQEYFSSHHEKRKKDPQKIHQPLSFMPQQGNIGDAEQHRKYKDERGRKQHISPGGGI